jgi:hypothetical protein
LSADCFPLQSDAVRRGNTARDDPRSGNPSDRTTVTKITISSDYLNPGLDSGRPKHSGGAVPAKSEDQAIAM